MRHEGRCVLAIGGALAALALAACGEAPHDLVWELSLDDPDARDRVAAFALAIRQGGCFGEPVFEVQARVGETPSRRPGRLPPGRYGFAAAARDADCGVLASGCQGATLPLSPGGEGPARVVVRLGRPGTLGACAGGGCDLGLCIEEGADAGPRDAGEAPDACVERVEECNGEDDDCDGDADEGFDLSTDPEHCGGCGIRCGGTCERGECVGARECGGAETACDGACVDTLSDPGHCGGCGLACALPNATAGCSAGACRVDGCVGSFEDCNGVDADGCEADLATSSDHCGDCGERCAVPGATAECVEGRCAVVLCSGSLRDCNGDPDDGCEADIESDVDHCGACDRECTLAMATARCAAGHCEIASCLFGFGDCNEMAADGCEQPLSSDDANCGACGNECGECTRCVGSSCLRLPPGDSCWGGVCTSGGCCRGCVGIGGLCRPGTGSEACGTGGDPCQRCAGTEICSPTGCEPG